LVITEQKPFSEIAGHLKKGERIFIVECGECSTTCKTGGEEEVLALKRKLQEEGFSITGFTVPKAPCIASHVKSAIANNFNQIKESDSYLILTCGLGAQSVIANDRLNLPVHIGCNTLFMGMVGLDTKNFFEVCSACGDCMLEDTSGICALTQCPKGILNGPCGGMAEGKCEADRDRECVWVTIYNRLKERGRLESFFKIYPAKDFSKHKKPRHKVIS